MRWKVSESLRAQRLELPEHVWLWCLLKLFQIRVLGLHGFLEQHMWQVLKNLTREFVLRAALLVVEAGASERDVVHFFVQSI